MQARARRYRTEVTERRLLLVNGPNLNLLGTRQPEIYGSTTLADIEKSVTALAAEFGFEVRAVQSNHEGALVDAIQAARTDCAGIIINPAAYSHTSVAIADALTSVELPVAEVHLSNIHRREEFRHHSYVSAVAEMVICGAGAAGYEYAVRYLVGRV
ncbi:3-dehydroquinate dehydratase [Mycolicibacterium smegmatis]|uniref:3-dehydroquinate dehydratase n=1 Tax=Mycolicibacterium smegmatis TaxID=1772 RepID=A0A653FHH8_MYCSM|nr:3-dehydroquinate dehydratase [Mycolicibacterium smegmatis]VTP09120.1 3-dehydroquinate dehydratase [Mycolicibacterium smegmatis]